MVDWLYLFFEYRYRFLIMKYKIAHILKENQPDNPNNQMSPNVPESINRKSACHGLVVGGILYKTYSDRIISAEITIHPWSDYYWHRHQKFQPLLKKALAIYFSANSTWDTDTPISYRLYWCKGLTYIGTRAKAISINWSVGFIVIIILLICGPTDSSDAVMEKKKYREIWKYLHKY